MEQERDIVYLVDGTAYIHRAYHAIRQLTNSKGLPTNAVLGFTKMILKLVDEKKPDYMIIAFDVKGPTFRHQFYKDYKANRPPMLEDMVSQIPYIKKVLKGLNIKMIEKEGYEADDIIGTLARIGEEHGFRVIMVTGDKDFRQLITPRISMWDTMKDKFTDYEAIKQKYGLEPGQIIELMGLSGDSADNIPGVPGIGEKTAANLIRQFGTLESVFLHLEDIPKRKLKENLERSEADAILSKKLVTIERRVPIDVNINDLKVGEPDREYLGKIFHELEFRGLWGRFSQREENLKTDYRLCLSEDELLAVIKIIEEKAMVSIDTETTSSDPLNAELVGISFSVKETEAYYLPLRHYYLGVPDQLEPSKAIRILKGMLENENIAKIGQNIKYDAIVFKRHGVKLGGIWFDTMLASYVINPGLRQHNLDYLAQHYLNHKMITFNEVVGKGKNAINFSEVEIERASEYSCEDSDVTLRLMSILDRRFQSDKNQELFYNLEMKLLPVLIDMELMGVKIDAAFFRQMSKRFGEQINNIRKEIYEEAGMEFNINSPKQLSHVLFEKLQLPVLKKTAKTGSYSTDVRVLKKLASSNFKLPNLLLRYRTLTKLKSTYLDTLVKMVNPDTNRIHTSFNQTVTATGRLSSSNPNLQNIPIRGDEGREIRKGFVAEKGYFLLSADYSQVELRVFAHYSGDKVLVDAFRNEEDIHTRTASEVFGVTIDDVTTEMRRISKTINFGIIYGMGPRKLGEELGIDNKTAKDYIDSYYEKYHGVTKYKDEILASARERGYVTTLFNRRRYLPEIIHSKQRIRADAERIAINTPIQGTAADLIKMAMINIHSRLKEENFKTKLLLQVHDELVFEVPDNEIEVITPIIKKEMETVYKLDVPLKVDIHWGRNWNEAH